MKKPSVHTALWEYVGFRSAFVVLASCFLFIQTRPSGLLVDN